MAGMEQLEIHSKSYLIRWISVPASHTISWSLQPHKKSISFGIFKHSGPVNGATPQIPSHTFDGAVSAPPTSDPEQQQTTQRTSRAVSSSSIATAVGAPRGDSPSSSSTSQVIEKLDKLGIKCVAWTGKCEADRVSMGNYDVPEGEGAYYGLLFDNTYAKQFSKTVTFVLMTYATSAPPKSGHHLHFSQAMTRKGSSSYLSSSAGGGSGTKLSPSMLPVSDSQESLPPDTVSNVAAHIEPRPKTQHGMESQNSLGSTFYTGILSKKRRKRNQGYAKRFFSLDYTSLTLSYYKNRNSSALRGAIPLSLAAIGADEKSRQLSIDSGAEIWLLKAPSRKDFDGWIAALEKASQTQVTAAPSGFNDEMPSQSRATNPEENMEWERAEGLVGRVAGITDAVRRLTKDTDPKYSSSVGGLGISESYGNGSATSSPVDRDGPDYFTSGSRSPSRPSFWKRKVSSSDAKSQSSKLPTIQRPISSSLAPPTPSGPINIPKRRGTPVQDKPEESIHDHCLQLLRDLDRVVAEFSSLLAESRQRRMPEIGKLSRAGTRLSVDTTQSQEFFDADEGLAATTSTFLPIRRDSFQGDGAEADDDGSADADSVSSSDIEGEEDYSREPRAGKLAPYPSQIKSLYPLPRPAIKRRTTVPPSSGAPPSLISFLRKNVGKDLTTIAMPVTANEPLSLLQRQAEELEYSSLLDSAVAASTDTGERILHIAAFAISNLSAARSKERAIRKPFNPMLGETYELVREDKGFRYLAEKISHRPVRVACQADAKDWSYTHTAAPSQKFWGKSAELVSEGRARVVLHDATSSSRGTASDQTSQSKPSYYSWQPATCFLRNIIAGEKYVEPSGTLTIVEETSGAKAVATFKSGGMFSGRAEDVSVAAYSPSGSTYPLSLSGKWTTHLTLHSSSSAASSTPGIQIWTATPLPSDAAHRYGMPEFAAQLNQITEMERDAIPPTDSRLRPDQRAYEDGNVDKAETLKLKLEEAQRRRRKVMEDADETWKPRWFERIEGGGAEADGETWVVKTGNGEGYWDVRRAVVDLKSGKWDGVREVFEV